MRAPSNNGDGQPRIVIFGAGNIGRSFIAPVFTRGGYEVVFADVNPAVLTALQSRNSYELVLKTDASEFSRQIGPVRGIDAGDAAAVKKELDAVDICVTCVGAGALPAVLESISRAVAGRTEPLDIILAENLKGAGEMAKSTLSSAAADPGKTSPRIGIVETSIGKMVPIMPAEVAASDPLLSWAEPYNTLIVDNDAFQTPVPEIDDLMPVSPIEPWVARKLYIHNFGHAAAAYLGFRAKPEGRYIWEVLEDPGVAGNVKAAMTISGQALRNEYPGIFTQKDIEDHIADLLHRFSNRSLGDTVYRVGRDLARKLHRNDRVVGALGLALKHNLDTQPALDVFTAALDFIPSGPDGQTDPADQRVRTLTGDPVRFLNDIIQIDPANEHELSSILNRVLVGNCPLT